MSSTYSIGGMTKKIYSSCEKGKERQRRRMTNSKEGEEGEKGKKNFKSWSSQGSVVSTHESSRACHLRSDHWVPYNLQTLLDRSLVNSTGYYAEPRRDTPRPTTPRLRKGPKGIKRTPRRVQPSLSGSSSGIASCR